jgi:hypothetical protein
MADAESSAPPDGKTITEHELEQCQRANQTGHQPVVFVHGRWLLPSSWDRWAKLVRGQRLWPDPGWPDDPETVGRPPSTRGVRRQVDRPDRRPFETIIRGLNRAGDHRPLHGGC